jgi:hypothetical protein
MAKYAARGTLLKLTISASLTTIVQMRNVRIGQTKSDTIQVDALDDSGIGHSKISAGTATQDDITADGWWDPDATTHKFVTGLIAAPSGYPIAGSIVTTDATPASTTFSAIGFGFGATANVNEALTCEINIETNGVVTWPT